MPPRPSAATIRYRLARIVPAANRPAPDQLEFELLVLVGFEELVRFGGAGEEGVFAAIVSPPKSVGVALISSADPHSGQNRLVDGTSRVQAGQRIVEINSL
jgi:hypothetical protein